MARQRGSWSRTRRLVPLSAWRRDPTGEETPTCMLARPAVLERGRRSQGKKQGKKCGQSAWAGHEASPGPSKRPQPATHVGNQEGRPWTMKDARTRDEVGGGEWWIGSTHSIDGGSGEFEVARLCIASGGLWIIHLGGVSSARGGRKKRRQGGREAEQRGEERWMGGGDCGLW